MLRHTEIGDSCMAAHIGACYGTKGLVLTHAKNLLAGCYQANANLPTVCANPNCHALNRRCEVKNRVQLFSLLELASGAQAIQRRQMSQMRQRTVLSTTRACGSHYQLMNCYGQLSTQR